MSAILDVVAATTPIPIDYPVGRTARRLGWVHLPPRVRAEVERRLGSAVIEDVSATAGFTPGLASVLICADGSTHFVKAASTKAQKVVADAYRGEVSRLRALPPTTPAPRLRWSTEIEDWVVLSIEYVDGAPPARPWSGEDLARCSAMLVATAEALTPAPGIGIATFAEEVGSWAGLWRSHLAHLSHAGECGVLAARIDEVSAGETLIHGDLREDNLLLSTHDERAWLCDWAWPARGAAWIDSLLLLIGPRGDGLDVEAHLAAHPLLSTVAPDDIDTVLALHLGYFTVAADLPRVSNSPWLRTMAAWHRDVLHDWLAERRGWPL